MTPTSSSLTDDVIAILEQLRAHRPLVHCLTNQVVKNFTANALLALGAAPAMVEHPEEADAFARIASALLINVGTLDEMQMAAISRAAPAARAANRPWVLDPVAVGPLAVRTVFARGLLTYGPTLIRGNASEIIALTGRTGQGRGVDSGDSTGAALDAARELAAHTGAVVLVTGATDFATDGKRTFSCTNGHILMTRVTGVGCAQGAIAAACTAVAADPLMAAVATATLLGIAGDLAAERTQRPGSYQIALLDALDELNADLVRRRAKLA